MWQPAATTRHLRAFGGTAALRSSTGSAGGPGPGRLGGPRYRSVTSAHAADPRGHPGEARRRRARRPPDPRVLPGRLRAPRRRRRCSRGWPRPTRTRARASTSARWPRPSWPPTRRTSPSWPARSTSTRCGPASSSRCRPSSSSTVSARRASGAPATPCPTRWSAPTPSGVVLRVGSAVRNWKPGDRVTVHCNYVDDQDPSAHDDSMMAANQRIWGFETNFGGLADLTLVKANQLMPKPAHLTWEEAAVNALCNSTSYRMLVGAPRRPHEAGRRRARVGRHRRHRRLRRAVRAQRRWASPSAWCRHRRRPRCSRSWAWPP